MGNLKSSGRIPLAVSIAMIAMSSVAVSLRLVAKSYTRRGFAAEDWWILAAFFLFCADQGVFLGGLLTSGGSLIEITFTEYAHFLEYTYIIEFLFTATITAVKMSILCLYNTIFTTKDFRHASLVVGTLCVVWAIICLFVGAFQCKPVQAAWDLSLFAEAVCMPYGHYILGYELSNMFLDITILCLPIVMIRRLQLPLQRKILVSGMFLVGGFICIICIIRVYYLHNLNIGNPGTDLEDGMNWSNIEPAVAILCACLPTYGPLLTQASAMSSSFRSRFLSLRIKMSKRSSGDNSRQKSFVERADRYNHLGDSGEEDIHSTHIAGENSDRRWDGWEGSYQMNTIAVRKSVEVV